MIPFQYARANDIAEAVRLVAGDPKAKFIAGGTNLIDLMKMEVERPAKLIDITRLPLKQVEDTPEHLLTDRDGQIVALSEQVRDAMQTISHMRSEIASLKSRNSA